MYAESLIAAHHDGLRKLRKDGGMESQTLTVYRGDNELRHERERAPSDREDPGRPAG